MGIFARYGSRVLAVSALAIATIGGCATTYDDFSLRSLDGQSVSLSEQKGKVVLVAFWSST